MNRAFLLGCFFPVLCFAYEKEEVAPSRPPEKEITIPAQPWVKNGMAEPYLEADFIYWEVQEDGLEFAAAGYGTFDQPVNSRGKIYYPKFKKSPGFRVGVGVNLAHDGWDLFLRYTWLYSRAKNSQEGSFIPLWVEGPTPFLSEITETKVDWNIHLDVLDLEWGRNFYISRFLTLRPFFGLKGYWSDQTYDNHNSGSFVENNQRLAGVKRTHFIQDAWGIGVRFGLNGVWYIKKNWSVFGGGVLANEWSRFDLRRRDTGRAIDRSSEETLVHLRSKEYHMVPIIELTAGIRWETWFSNADYHALIQAGWEEQIWFYFNQMKGVYDQTGGPAPLQLQGLTFKFRFDF